MGGAKERGPGLTFGGRGLDVKQGEGVGLSHDGHLILTKLCGPNT